MLFGIVSTASAASKSPFKGRWSAVDVDGSNIRMTIAGGGRGVYRVIWVDDYWSICDGDPGSGRGTGTIDSANPNLMTVSLDIYCAGSFAGTFPMTFEYISGTDMIINPLPGSAGTVYWDRVGGGP